MSPQMNANERKWKRIIDDHVNEYDALRAGHAAACFKKQIMLLLYLRSFAFICGLYFAFNALPTLADNTQQPDIRELDRMFTTRYERAQLDAQRRRMSSGENFEASTASNVTAAPVNVEMQGIMQRENGGNVAWINGQSTLNSNTINDNIRVQGQPRALSGANVSIDGQTVRMKPGQVWQAENNKVDEIYKTKVTVPVTKGTDEAAVAVQTKEIIDGLSKIVPKAEPAKPDVTLPKP